MPAEPYSGSCQCGAVAYDVSVDLSSTISCNCSRCRRVGSILAFTPIDQFKLKTGEGATTTYQFNKHVIDHKFCKTCGVQAYSIGTNPKGEKMAAINVRCLDGVDVWALTPKKYDGANA